jgi:nucleotide-binding universal stress UspA family protein
MNILLAIDGSVGAQHAVDHLLQVVQPALREAPTVHLLYVHPPLPIGRVQAHIGHETLERLYREEGDALLDPVQAQLEDAGLPVVRHLHVGEPATLIAKLGDDYDCAWLLLGSHGRGSLGGALLGSVATKVRHLSARPVLLIK